MYEKSSNKRKSNDSTMMKLKRPKTSLSIHYRDTFYKDDDDKSKRISLNNIIIIIFLNNISQTIETFHSIPSQLENKCQRSLDLRSVVPFNIFFYSFMHCSSR